MTTVQDYVHKGRSFSWQARQPNKPELCQHSVAEYGRVTYWHQCSRKAVVEVDGVGFCKQHGEEVRRDLGYEVETNICFAANFRNGKPELTKVYFSKQTDSMITIEDWEDVIGDMFMMKGKQKKGQKFMSYSFFNTQAEAIQWLCRESVERYTRLIVEVGKAWETMRMLEAMVKEEEQ